MWSAVQVLRLNASTAPSSASIHLAAPSRKLLAGETVRIRIEAVAGWADVCPAAGDAMELWLSVCATAADSTPAGFRSSEPDPDVYASFSRDKPGVASSEFVSAFPGSDGLSVRSGQDEWLAAVTAGAVCRRRPGRGSGADADVVVASRGALHVSVWMRRPGAAHLCARAWLQRAVA